MKRFTLWGLIIALSHLSSCVAIQSNEESGEEPSTAVELERPGDLSNLDHESDPSHHRGSMCRQTLCGDLCVDLESDPRHCSQCDLACIASQANSICERGTCLIDSCYPSYSDEDGDYSNGCELSDQPLDTMDPLCSPGGRCLTSCDTHGEVKCEGDQEVCLPPNESCNLEDDDCDGDCDEGISCRIGVSRGYSDETRRHIYSTDRSSVTMSPYHIETADYFYLYESAASGLMAVYSCRLPEGHTFLSTSSHCDQRGSLVRALGYWSLEPRCGSRPLYSLVHPGVDDHFYTTSATERENLVASDIWVDMGIIGYVW
jgi:hypothetical protein